MDKAEKKTRELMKVESFSQLPFIRPAQPVKEKGIRLFGIEFGGVLKDSDGSAAAQDEPGSSETIEETITKDGETTTVDTNRRFECHYCYRNFSTSQALGGHQNAHKRERQQAKRAHLHSAAGPTSPAMTYPSWNSHSRGHHPAAMFYSSPRSTSYGGQQPFNGSPLGLWPIPAAHGRATSFIPDRSFHLTPLFAGEELRLSDGGNPSSQGRRYGYETKPSVQDHPSLDLHL